ncbi:MAG: lysophospholipid acyltransferase family protein [Anaeromyxobacter sp.]
MPKGKRDARRSRPARKRPATKARRALLGNDPFQRGAAPRDPLLAARPEAPPAPPPRPPPPPAHAAAGLAEVERKVAHALDGMERRLEGLAGRAGLPEAGRDLREAADRLLPRIGDALSSLVDLARLLEPPARLDRHGMDPDFAQRAEPLLELLYRVFWRTAVRGAERVPSTGPVIVVANHGGAVPWDALVLRRALFLDHPARRDLRPLLDDREADASPFGPLAIRLGAVRAAPEPAERILKAGGMLGVFPEGSAVQRRPWRDRYRIQHFGRGGFAKLALRTGATIVPCAIVGSEEASPPMARSGWLAEKLGVPVLSLTPSLPVGPAGLVPLPSRWTLDFGEPVAAEGGPAAAEDAGRVAALTDAVRTTLQAMLDEAVKARGSVFL